MTRSQRIIATSPNAPASALTGESCVASGGMQKVSHQARDYHEDTDETRKEGGPKAEIADEQVVAPKERQGDGRKERQGDGQGDGVDGDVYLYGSDCERSSSSRKPAERRKKRRKKR
jgi:hypothetical protein